MITSCIYKLIDVVASKLDDNREDQAYAEQLGKILKGCTLDKELSSEQKELIQNVLIERGYRVFKTPNDYISQLNPINSYWIQLAELLHDINGKTAIQLLFPFINNSADPNSLMPLFTSSMSLNQKINSYFYGEDGETLYSVDGLMTLHIIHPDEPFSIYPNPVSDKAGNIKYNSRVLSLGELTQIRKKNIPVLHREFKYCNHWSFLTQSIMFNIRKKGELPRKAIYNLFEIVRDYFENSKSNISQSLQNLSKTLLALPSADVNVLYWQIVTIEGSPQYLVSVLMDCLEPENEDFLESIMKALAYWLCSYNAALIIKSNKLDEVYRELNAGPYFTFNALREHILNLKSISSPYMRDCLDAFLCLFPQKTNIDSDVLSHLEELYVVCDKQMKKNNKHHTSCFGKGSEKWLRLLELLSGAGYIKFSAIYNFLMPSLHLPETDNISEELLVHYPLNHFILSEHGSLILLDNSEAFYNVNKSFYNCNELYPRPFSAIENSRIFHASSKFHKYILISKYDKDRGDPLLSIETIGEVKKFIEACFDLNCLLPAKYYSSEQETKTSQAYQDFITYLENNPDQKKHLEAQRIVFNGQKVLFKSIFEKLKKGGCTANICMYLIQLVLDYFPHTDFMDEIEKVISKFEMRSRVNLKIPQEYGDIEEQEAKNLMAKFIYAIMRRQLPFSFLKSSFTLQDSFDSTDNVQEKLQKIINSLIKHNFKSARHDYMHLMESVVKPTLNSSGGQKGIESCFQAIEDHSFFDRFNLYNISSILKMLLEIYEEDLNLYRQASTLIDDMIRVLNQSCSTLMKQIIINSLLADFVDTLDDESKQFILNKINCIGYFCDSFNHLTNIFLTHRLAYLAASETVKKPWYAFFNQDKPIHTETFKLKYEEVKEILSRYIKTSLTETISNFESIIKTINNEVCSVLIRKNLLEYLEKISASMRDYITSRCEAEHPSLLVSR